MAPLPREPPISSNDSLSDESVTAEANEISTKEEKKVITKLEQECASFPVQSLVWKVNFLSAAVLGVVFSLLKQEHYIYIYAVLALTALDATRYYTTRGSMAGFPYSPPWVTITIMVLRPVKFWIEQGKLAKASADGLSCNALMGKFMVFITDVKLCRQVFTGEGTFQIFAHPNARWLFGDHNLIYMKTDPHKKFRAILTPALFSNEALTMYAKAQEKVCRKHSQKFADACESTGKAIDVRFALRSMTAAASQESFLGPYLTDELRKKLEADILTFTLGFLCFPFPYFGTGLCKAIQAKHRIEAVLRDMIPQAREYAAKGGQPRCLLEHWMTAMLKVAKEEGVNDPRKLPECSDLEVSLTALDFLFAAQDATNSALAFTLDVLATRPDVVSKIRMEVESLSSSQNIGDLVRNSDDLQYTNKTAVQLLHHKPPVPMVPHLVLKNATLAGRTIPKGSVVIPSILYSKQSVLDFDPETTDPDNMFVKTLTFGGGQHKCPGRKYAETLLTVFLATFVPNYEWERAGARPEQDDIIYLPTLFPSDNFFTVRPRSK